MKMATKGGRKTKRATTKGGRKTKRATTKKGRKTKKNLGKKRGNQKEGGFPTKHKLPNTDSKDAATKRAIEGLNESYRSEGKYSRLLGNGDLSKPEKWKTFINLDARIKAFNKTQPSNLHLTYPKALWSWPVLFKRDNLGKEPDNRIKNLVDKDVDLTENIESWGMMIKRLDEKQKIPALRYAIDQNKPKAILTFIKAEYFKNDFYKTIRYPTMGQDFIYATFALAYASSKNEAGIVDKILEEIDQRAKDEYKADKEKHEGEKRMTTFYESSEDYTENIENDVRKRVPFSYPEEVDTSIYALFMLNTPVPIENEKDKKRPIEYTTDDNIKKKIKKKIDHYTKIQRDNLKSQYDELIKFGHREIKKFDWEKEDYIGKEKDIKNYKKRLEEIEEIEAEEEAAEAAGTAPAEPAAAEPAEPAAA